MTDKPGEGGIAKRHNLPAREGASWSRDIVKQIAADIGKEVAHHIETMYPKAVEATSNNMLVSVRGCVFNEIMAAIKVNDAGLIQQRLGARKKFRRTQKAVYRKIRKKP